MEAFRFLIFLADTYVLLAFRNFGINFWNIAAGVFHLVCMISFATLCKLLHFIIRVVLDFGVFVLKGRKLH